MTVASPASKVTANGNGVTTVWPFNFRVIEESHLQVIVTDISGVDTPLSSGYSVGLTDLGGSVTYPLAGAPLPVGAKITILRVVPLTQETDLTNQGGFYAETVEDRFDLLTMADQQQQEELDRTVKLSVSDTNGLTLPPPSERAGRLLGFDAAGAFAVTTSQQAIDQVSAQLLAAAAEASIARNQAVPAAAIAEAARDLAVPAAAEARTSATTAVNAASAIAGFLKGPATTTAAAYSLAGKNLGDLAEPGAFFDERMPSVRIDLAHGTGATIDLGSIT